MGHSLTGIIPEQSSIRHNSGCPQSNVVRRLGKVSGDTPLSGSLVFVRVRFRDDQRPVGRLDFRRQLGRLQFALVLRRVRGHQPVIHRLGSFRLLEFFASPEAQQHIARHNNEFPASPDVSAPAPVDRYASFTANPMPVAAFAARQPRAQALMSEAGWR